MNRGDNRTDDDRVDEAIEGSFPASDPPSWTLGYDPPQPFHQGENRQHLEEGAAAIPGGKL